MTLLMIVETALAIVRKGKHLFYYLDARDSEDMRWAAKYSGIQRHIATHSEGYETIESSKRQR